MSYLDLTIEEIKKALDDKKVTPKELLDDSIARAKKYQESLNSFVTIIEDHAKNQIENLNNMEDSFIKGIPYALKDNFSTKGILTTGSSNILKDYIPIFDATSVIKLNSSGAIMIGKTALDELGMGGTGTTGHTGSVKNPWDMSRIIGGSSAGSAAVVAAGIVPFSIGSDTGDSIRKPAAIGGIVGYKPTYGLISRYGLFAFASSLDHVGVFTRSVKDAAYVTDVLKGKDEKDMTSLPSDNTKLSDIDGNIKNKKLFYIKQLLDRENSDEELNQILDNFDDVIKKVEELGFEIVGIDFDIDLLKAIIPCYFTISCAEATSNNSNLTGIMFGSKEDGNSPDEIMFNTRTKGFSELIKRRFVLGSFILQKENQEKLFLNAQRIRRLIVDKLTELFASYDGMILPAQEAIAPRLDSKEINRLSEEPSLLSQHLAMGNFGGFPSIVIPCGFVDNMPIGLSITSGVNCDFELLNIAYAIEGTMNYKGQIAGGEK